MNLSSKRTINFAQRHGVEVTLEENDDGSAAIWFWGNGHDIEPDASYHQNDDGTFVFFWSPVDAIAKAVPRVIEDECGLRTAIKAVASNLSD